MIAPSKKVREHVTETVLVLGCAALAGATLLPGRGVPGGAVTALWCTSAVIGAVTAYALTGSGAVCAWSLALGGWLAGWSAWAWPQGVWHAAVMMWWLLGLIVLTPLGVLAAAARRREPQKAIEAGPSAEELARQEELAKWDHLFATVDCAGVQTLKVSNDEPSGRVIHVQLPRDGKLTISSLEAAAPRMEVALRTQPHALTFRHMANSGEVEIRVRERDQMAKPIPLTPAHYAQTIKKPFAVGMREDSKVMNLSLREMHMLLIGVTGAGKSNLINVLIAQMGRMVDTVIWVIDMKGGRVARPWLQPWSADETDDPVIDWVATTREEAALMMNAFVAAITTRMNSGLGGSKITPNASTPQIILITDEMADLFGTEKGPRLQQAQEAGVLTNRQFLELAGEITRKGRSEAASTVWASQRGTNSMAGSGDLKSNCKLRVLLGTVSEAEARYVINDSPEAWKLATAASGITGAGVVGLGQRTSLLVKFFHLDHPEDPETEESLCENGCVPQCPVRQTAIETGRMRPRLDAMTAEGMGEVYATRWERAGNLITSNRPARVAAAVGTERFEEILASGGMRDPEEKVDPRRLRMREILASRGHLGATPKYLGNELAREGRGVARETIQRWLASDAETDLVHSADDFGRWKYGPRPENPAA